MNLLFLIILIQIFTMLSYVGVCLGMYDKDLLNKLPKIKLVIERILILVTIFSISVAIFI